MTTMTMEIYILFYFMLAQASHNHSHRLFSFTSYFVEFVQKYTYFSSYFLHLFLTLFRICTYSSFSETYSYAHILLFLRLFLLRIFRFLQNLFLCTTFSSPTQRNILTFKINTIVHHPDLLFWKLWESFSLKEFPTIDTLNSLMEIYFREWSSLDLLFGIFSWHTQPLSLFLCCFHFFHFLLPLYDF